MPGFPWSDGQFLLAADLNAEFAAVLAQINARALNAKDYGTVGDGSTDDTVALQSAIDAAVAAQVPLYIPSGRYLISAALVITRGVRIFGAYVEPETAMFLSSPNPGGNGTWIVLDGTHLVSVFYINPGGTPSASNQTMGVEIDHIAIIHAHPAPGPGWLPTVYPPAIDIPAGSDVYLHDLFLMNPFVGISAAGQPAGRLTIERVNGQPLRQGIALDNQTDTVSVRDVHFWTYWSLDSNVLAYQKANGVGLQLGRVDDATFHNFFCLWYWIGAQISATANGPTTAARFTACDFNICGNPFVINDGVGGNSVYLNGCILDGTHDATSTSGLSILGAGGSNTVFVSNSFISNVGNHCVSVESGSSNHVRLSACQLFQWDLRNVGAFALQGAHTNTIRMDASCLSFSVNSNDKVLAGGQCLKTPAMWLTHGTMLAASTSIVLPHLLDVVPTMMLVTPNGGPIAGATRQWWATADASNVTVHVDTAPGSDVAFSVLVGVEN